jgi:predicted nuclease of predicted toxin-antitoxin system
VKLLFDQNLSNRLINDLEDCFPGSQHVRTAGLSQAEDEAVWEYARDNQLVIISKDADFHQRSFLYGAPPKVIWVRLGNCTTADIETILRNRLDEIRQFSSDDAATFLILSNR